MRFSRPGSSNLEAGFPTIAARVSTFFLPIAAGVVLGIATVCLLVRQIWWDQSWCLYVASRLLAGAHLYGADIQDTNPPLIYWMSTIPVALGQAIGVTAATGLVLCLIFLTAGIIFWSLRLSADADPGAKPFTPWLAVLLVAVTTVWPYVTLHLQDAGHDFGVALRSDFGQREHILALLILPYLFAAARRLEARGLSTFESILVGIAAAIGFSLKPQYLVVAVVVEVLLIYRRRDFRNLIRPELVTLVLAGSIYCAAIWIVTPDYIKAVIPMDVKVYVHWHHVTVLEMIGSYKRSVIAAAVIALILMRGSGFERLAATFLAAGAGAFVAFLIQGKGWPNHALPSEMFVLLSLGIAAVGHFLRWLNSCGAPRPGRIASILATVLSYGVVIGLYYPARVQLSAKSEQELSELNRVTADLVIGSPILILPYALTDFNLVLDRGFVWGSRYWFFLLPTEFIQRPAGLASVQAHTFDDGDSYVRMLRAEYIADFQRWHPKLVLVRRDDNTVEPYPPHFDVMGWLSIDPAFASIWSQYKAIRSVGPYDLYMRDEN
jgi:hypothetical protein